MENPSLNSQQISANQIKVDFSEFLLIFTFINKKNSLGNSTYFYDEAENQINIVNEKKTSGRIYKEKNRIEEGSQVSDVSGQKNDRKIIHRPLSNSFPHDQCFFLSYQEKYIVLARVQNRKFNLDESSIISHNPGIYCDYLAQKLKLFPSILQYGGKSANQIAQVH